MRLVSPANAIDTGDFESSWLPEKATMDAVESVQRLHSPVLLMYAYHGEKWLVSFLSLNLPRTFHRGWAGWESFVLI